MEHASFLSDSHAYEEIQEFICIRILNYEHYCRELEPLAHIHWEDLAITFFYLGNESRDCQIPIYQKDLKCWGLDLYELMRQAATQSGILHPPIFRPMQDILQIPVTPEENWIPLYVLSCEAAGYGASVMLYPGLLAEIAEELKGDLYVIPSSVHELIVLQAGDLQEPERLLPIIADVNRTVVLPGDYLSNSLYIYHRRRGELERYGTTPGSFRMPG